MAQSRVSSMETPWPVVFLTIQGFVGLVDRVVQRSMVCCAFHTLHDAHTPTQYQGF